MNFHLSSKARRRRAFQSVAALCQNRVKNRSESGKTAFFAEKGTFKVLKALFQREKGGFEREKGRCDLQKGGSKVESRTSKGEKGTFKVESRTSEVESRSSKAESRSSEVESRSSKRERGSSELERQSFNLQSGFTVLPGLIFQSPAPMFGFKPIANRRCMEMKWRARPRRAGSTICAKVPIFFERPVSFSSPFRDASVTL